MAKRTPAADVVFSAAEAVVLGLYDSGVLSPAVLQRVIAGFAQSGIRWNSECVLRSVDDKSLHEVVALTMMPGRAIRNAEKDFSAVLAHLNGTEAAAKVDAETEDPSDELMEQLGGSAHSKPLRKPPAKSKQAPAPGFNPLFRASAPGRATK